MDIYQFLDILELPRSSLYKISNSGVSISTKLNLLKELIISQRKKLAKKYHEGGKSHDPVRMRDINVAVDNVLSLGVSIFKNELYGGNYAVKNLKSTSKPTWRGFY